MMTESTSHSVIMTTVDNGAITQLECEAIDRRICASTIPEFRGSPLLRAENNYTDTKSARDLFRRLLDIRVITVRQKAGDIVPKGTIEANPRDWRLWLGAPESKTEVDDYERDLIDELGIVAITDKTESPVSVDDIELIDDKKNYVSDITQLKAAFRSQVPKLLPSHKSSRLSLRLFGSTFKSFLELETKFINSGDFTAEHARNARPLPPTEDELAEDGVEKEESEAVA